MVTIESCWSIIGNGFRGTLLLGVDERGLVRGTMFGDPVHGFWHAAAQRLTLYRMCVASMVDSIQIYTGYRFEGGMAGTFEAFATSGATPERSVFGWYATPVDPASVLG